MNNDGYNELEEFIAFLQLDLFNGNKNKITMISEYLMKGIDSLFSRSLATST